MKTGNLAFNWFDFVVLAILVTGVFRGRSRGISEELLDLTQVLVVVVLAGMSYASIGGVVADYTHVGKTTGYVIAYATVLLVIRGVFGWIKQAVGEKLVASDVFGRWEYYLGMLAGAARFGCGLLIGLAFLNAAYVTPEKLAANSRMQQENFGDISFPTLGTLHQNVFAGSASGRLVKEHLEHELIVPPAPGKNSNSADTIARKRERSVAEILDDKR